MASSNPPRDIFPRMRTATLVVIILLTGAVPRAFTCECIADKGGTFEERVRARVERSDAIFTGKVVRIEQATVNGSLVKRVTVEVDRIWKGVVQSTLPIVTGSGGADCGFPFELDASYLVYAYSYKADVKSFHQRSNTPDLERLATDRCQRTKKVSEQEPGELNALDSGTSLLLSTDSLILFAGLPRGC